MLQFQLTLGQNRLKLSPIKVIKTPRELLSIWIFAFYHIISIIFLWRLFLVTPENRQYFTGDFVGYCQSFYHFAKNYDGIFDFLQWTSKQNLGMPFLALLDRGFFNPLYFVLIPIVQIFNLSFYNFYFIFEIFAVTNGALAGYFFYIFLNKSSLKISQPVAVLGGLLFTLSGHVLLVLNTVSLLSTIVWFPLIFLFVDRYAISGETKPLIFASIFQGFAALSGIPEYTIYYNFILFPFLLERILASQNKDKLGKFTFKYILIFPTIALAVSMVQIFPSMELLSVSSRDASYFPSISAYQRIIGILGFIYPWEGSVEGLNFYNGILVPIMGLTLFHTLAWSQIQKRRRQLIFWSLATLLSFILSLGFTTFLYDLIYMTVPFIDNMRNIFKYASVFNFGSIVIMGIVLDELLKLNSNAKVTLLRFYKYLFKVGLALILVGVFFFPLSEIIFLKPPYSSYWKTFFDIFFIKVLLFLGYILLFIFHLKKSNHILLLICLGFLYIVDMNSIKYLIPEVNSSKANPNFMFNKNDLTKFLEYEYNSEPFRVQFMATLPGNYSFYLYQFDDVAGYEGFTLKGGYRLNNLLLADSRASGFINVKYKIFLNEAKNDIVGLKLVKTIEINNKNKTLYYKNPSGGKWVQTENGDTLKVFEVKSFRPRLFMNFTKPFIVNNLDDIELEDCLLNLKNNLIKQSPVHLCVDKNSVNPDLSSYMGNDFSELPTHEPKIDVDVNEFKSSEIRLSVNTPKEGILVFTNNFYPGWKVYIDGEQAEILNVLGGLQGVLVKKGFQNLRFYFQINNFKFYLFGSCLSLLLLLFTVILIKKNQQL